MKSLLQKFTPVFFALFFVLSVSSSADNKDVVEVSSLLELRSQETGGATVYELTGEAILIFQQSFRNKKWIQDDGAGIEIDDNSGIITTQYDLGDGITGLKGTLDFYQGNFQFIPVEDPGDPSSTENEMTAVTRSLDELTADDQGRLVHIEDLIFDEDHHGNNFSTGTNYTVSDATGFGTFRTHFFTADYIGAPIPTEEINLTAVLHMYNDNIQFTARGLADMGITNMHNLAALRNQAADNETIYTLTSEAILTYQQSFRNQKYIQDDTAGILIDDNPGVITSDYDIYDGITGLQGRLSVFGNMLQFVPVEDPGAATSSDNVAEPVVITLEHYIDNFMDYQARLVTIENVSFLTDPGETFSNGQVYEFSDGEFVAPFRTTFYDVDYIGDPIPTGEFNLTGLPNSRNDGDYLSARNWTDIESLTTFAVTFEFFDEGDQAVDGVTLEFRGETLTEAPYHFPEVPVGTHQFTATKSGYHPTQSTVSVADDDVNKQVILVEIDPNMVVEFPWAEQFDGTAFPPEEWSHYVLGDGTGWELQNEQAYHRDTQQGQTADSWLITPQIQLPEDETLLLTFLEQNQFMTDYGYSGVLISAGSGNPEHGHFTELYESDENIGIDNPSEAMLNLSDYAGHVVYLAFNYQGEFAHRWWVDDVMIDFAPEAIEVPNLASLKQQSISEDLIYRVTGEVVITCLQLPYRNQFYIQDETAAILVDDAPGVVETAYELYDGITGFTGHLGEFQDMLQILPTEDPGEATSHDNEVDPLEITLADITPDHQGLLVVVRSVSFDLENSPAQFTHNQSYFIYDDTGEGEIRTPNAEGLFDYYETPVPETPKDIIGVLHQRYEVVRLQPRMLADFTEPGDDDDTGLNIVSDDNINIYPNPAGASITIDGGKMNIEHIRVFNLNGQAVMESTTASTILQMDISTLREGMYIVQITSGNDVFTKKLSISR